MGLSRAEFFRLLPAVFGGVAPPLAGDRLRVAETGRVLEIVVGPERERALGPTLRLPCLAVELVLCGYGPDEARRFVEHFDRQYQRAGG